MSFLQYMLFLVVIILISPISSSTFDIESTTPSFANKVLTEIQKLLDQLDKDEKQLIMDRQQLEEDKQISKSIENNNVLQLNIGGQMMVTTRETLTKISKSILFILFNGRWEHKLQRDQEGNIFLDFNPILFRHLLDQLQVLNTNNLINIHPPPQPSLVEPFKKMLKKLGVQQFLFSEKKNIITFNVRGQIITNRRTTFIQVSNSTFDNIVPLTQMIHFNNQTDVFLDYDPTVFQHLINQLRKQSFTNISPVGLSSNDERSSFKRMLIDLSIFVVATKTTTTHITTASTSTTTHRISTYPPISINRKWKQNGVTVAGGHGGGHQSNQLNGPEGIYVDDDHQSIYIADFYNDRIVEWKYDAKMGQIVAGGNDGVGNRTHQLNRPTDVIVDKKTDSLIICDRENRRVMRWSRRNGTNGQTIISDIDCWGVTMDNNGDLYVSDTKKNEVRRWKIGEQKGTIVAGENSSGDGHNQLNWPTYLFVDKDNSIYVTDRDNHRVMKWVKGAKEGIVVAGGQGHGNSLRQLNYPQGVIVDHLGDVYVADFYNHRIMCWSKASKEGRVIVGGNGHGSRSDQLPYPKGLSFDRQGHLYVVDGYNRRVQKFLIDSN